jgi:hypothetical protein
MIGCQISPGQSLSNQTTLSLLWRRFNRYSPGRFHMLLALHLTVLCAPLPLYSLLHVPFLNTKISECCAHQPLPCKLSTEDYHVCPLVKVRLNVDYVSPSSYSCLRRIVSQDNAVHARGDDHVSKQVGDNKDRVRLRMKM